MLRRAAWASALIAALAGSLVGGCSRSAPSPLADCDAFIAAIDKTATCPALSSDARARLATSAKTMRASLHQLAQGGGPSTAPPELVELLRDSCRAQLYGLLNDPKLAACAK
ncbi:MAG TPA: hypothetical protein VM513_14105 [Kofleriaceae bacterium]|jgi:hypothetical protein|nr:hypothetical protein [Kofleriaceae bacterium]